jgi:hypothetical protein
MTATATSPGSPRIRQISGRMRAITNRTIRGPKRRHCAAGMRNVTKGQRGKP